jgi:hypothetical protein
MGLVRRRRDPPPSTGLERVEPSAPAPDDRAWSARRNVPERVELGVTLRDDPDGGAILRLGPLTHRAAWLAIEAFLGRPIEEGD